MQWNIVVTFVVVGWMSLCTFINCLSINTRYYLTSEACCKHCCKHGIMHGYYMHTIPVGNI